MVHPSALGRAETIFRLPRSRRCLSGGRETRASRLPEKLSGSSGAKFAGGASCCSPAISRSFLFFDGRISGRTEPSVLYTLCCCCVYSCTQGTGNPQVSYVSFSKDVLSAFRVSSAGWMQGIYSNRSCLAQDLPLFAGLSREASGSQVGHVATRSTVNRSGAPAKKTRKIAPVNSFMRAPPVFSTSMKYTPAKKKRTRGQNLRITSDFLCKQCHFSLVFVFSYRSVRKCKGPV